MGTKIRGAFFLLLPCISASFIELAVVNASQYFTICIQFYIMLKIQILKCYMDIYLHHLLANVVGMAEVAVQLFIVLWAKF